MNITLDIIQECYEEHLVESGADYDATMDQPVTDEFISDYLEKIGYSDEQIEDFIASI